MVWGPTWGKIRDVLVTICKFITGIQDWYVDLSGKDRVPRFWADDQSSGYVSADLIVLLVGVCFGAIHCISWGFSFPTHTELLMWRVFCVAIIVVPVYISLGLLLGLWLEGLGLGRTVFYFFPISGVILYILARAVTLVLAFTSLRDLPHGAYETVHWTTFIPHV